MVWIIFTITAVLIVLAATQLAKYGDIIAVRTRLGGMFIGVLLLAGATSLPEVLTSISSLNQNAPNLAAGNLLGSNTFNMLLLAVPITLPDIPEGTASLRRGIIGFLLAAGALVVVTPIMVQSANEIAVITGLGATFIGTTLVALVTSLPELVTTLAAIKIGADDIAIGNLFGSNMFNMFALGFTDVFFTQGRFLAAIDPSFLLIGVVGLLMTGMGLIGNLAKLEKRIWFIEVDALALIIVYLASLWLLYTRG